MKKKRIIKLKVFKNDKLFIDANFRKDSDLMRILKTIKRIHHKENKDKNINKLSIEIETIQSELQ